MRQGLVGHIEGRLMLEPLEARLLLDGAAGIAVDSLGNVLVVGQTGSAGWVSGGFDTSRTGIMTPSQQYFALRVATPVPRHRLAACVPGRA